jgi:hypothetical protein
MDVLPGHPGENIRAMVVKMLKCLTGDVIPQIIPITPREALGK